MTHVAEKPLFDVAAAAERVRAARERSRKQALEAKRNEQAHVREQDQRAAAALRAANGRCECDGLPSKSLIAVTAPDAPRGFKAVCRDHLDGCSAADARVRLVNQFVEYM